MAKQGKVVPSEFGQTRVVAGDCFDQPRFPGVAASWIRWINILRHQRTGHGTLPAVLLTNLRGLMLEAGRKFLNWVLAETTQTTPAIDPVWGWFQELGWRVEQLPQGVRWQYRGQQGQWWCLALLREECFTCYSRYPQAARPEQLAPLSELLSRINYGLALGNWELDWRDGDIRYKTSVDMLGVTPDARWLKRFLAAHLGTFDHYWPAVDALLTQGVSPVMALAQVEQLPLESHLGHPRGKPK